MKKLELKHVLPYACYGLKGNVIDYEENQTFVNERLEHICLRDSILSFPDAVDVYLNEQEISQFKPILRPLSDLNNNEYSNLFVQGDIDNILDAERIDESLDVIEFYLVQQLISLHFDVFGLIEKGLAIDINTL